MFLSQREKCLRYIHQDSVREVFLLSFCNCDIDHAGEMSSLFFGAFFGVS